MRLTTLRLSNFQSFGPAPTSLELSDLSYVLGPNGSGKTAVLIALSRLFSPHRAQREVQLEDFHVPAGREGPAVGSGSTLWLEVDIAFPEASEAGEHASIPPHFAHMRLVVADTAPRIRVRLTATLASDGVVEEKLEYIVEVDDNDTPTKRADMSRHDRSSIEVHYLPARRDPLHHISYTAASLVGRTLRAVDWTSERKALARLTGDITDAVGANKTVSSIATHLASEWAGLHKGDFFKDPSIAFGRGEIDGVLNQLTVNFSPSHGGNPLPFDRLSDGQKSLLYISLVLAWQALARRVLAKEEDSLDPTRLGPPVHTVLALEEPENSLGPQYLGRIVRQLRVACSHGDAQAVIATHAPTLLRRVAPESICFLRLSRSRESTVRRITLPSSDAGAAKYVREAVQAYPELYFSRLVILGEGDSEQVVLPRVLAASGIAEDDASVSVVPLGGRHVNHFWRLLNDLEIPYVTLLDLDSGRFGAGWGRVRNAARQINELTPKKLEQTKIDRLPAWNDDCDFPKYDAAKGHLRALESRGIFFSAPLDLDLLMLQAYPSAYDVNPVTPADSTIVSVLGKSHANHERLGEDVLALFDDYHSKFDLASKPSTHLAALAALTDEELLQSLPGVLERLVAHVSKLLGDLPE